MTDYIPLWGVVILAIGVGLIVGLLVATAGTYLMKLWLRWKYGTDALDPSYKSFNDEEEPVMHSMCTRYTCSRHTHSRTSKGNIIKLANMCMPTNIV